jgi:hypothetical protein
MNSSTATKEFLLYAAEAAGDNEGKELLDKLAFGRNAYLAEEELLSRFHVAKGKMPEMAPFHKCMALLAIVQAT